MTILDKLLSALGLGREREDRETETPTVTVEHEPDASEEAAVKGVDAGATGDEGAVMVGETEDTGDDAGAADEDADTGTVGTADDAAAADEDADAGAAEDDATAGESVETLKGIGPAYAGKLEAAGAETVGDLADADADDLAERTSLSAKRVGRWIERARERRDA